MVGENFASGDGILQRKGAGKRVGFGPNDVTRMIGRFCFWPSIARNRQVFFVGEWGNPCEPLAGGLEVG